MENKEKIKQLERELDAKPIQKCEVYSRVVGYFRPTEQWNKGKNEEFDARKTFEKIVKN